MLRRRDGFVRARVRVARTAVFSDRRRRRRVVGLVSPLFFRGLAAVDGAAGCQKMGGGTASPHGDGSSGRPDSLAAGSRHRGALGRRRRRRKRIFDPVQQRPRGHPRRSERPELGHIHLGDRRR